MYFVNAEVKVKDSAGKVIASQPFQKPIFEGNMADADGRPVLGPNGTAEQLLGDAIEYLQKQVGEKGNGVLELLAGETYANDLNMRQKIRQALVAAVEGPDKAIEKMVKDYMTMRAAMGKPVTEEAARAKVALLKED